MHSSLVVPVLAVSVTALGSVIVLQFLTPFEWRSIPGIFASTILGTVLGGWTALILAEIGLFSAYRMILLWAVLFLVFSFFAYLRRERVEDSGAERAASESRGDETRDLGNRVLPYALLLWLFAAAWLYFRPHEYILGGADAGVYVSLGAEIAQNGGFALHDETLAELQPAVQAAFLRPLTTNPIASSYLLPGFYIEDAGAGEVTPQFYPLHPVWQAIAFGLSDTVQGGVRAELLIVGLWMTLASVAVVLTARELGGPYAALLVMAALSLNALQVWFARYPTTEALTQFLLWSGLWASLRWLGDQRPANLWALVSGSALGSVFLVRIDILVLLPLFLLFGILLFWRGWKISNWWFFVPLTLQVIHSFVHGLLLSAPYFGEHIGFGLRLLWSAWWLVALASIIGVLLLWLASSYRGQYATKLERLRTPLLLMLCAGFLVYALHGWFIRPVMLQPVLRPDLYSESLILTTNHENWRRLAWYFSAPGIWAGVAGIVLLIWRVERRSALLVAVGLLFSIIYLWNVRANPHQIYVMRRYVPAVVPFFLLAGAYLFSQLPLIADRVRHSSTSSVPWGRASAVILAFVWLALIAWSARGLVSQVDHQSVLSQLTRINEQIPPDSVLLFNDQSPVGLGDFWGTPLKYIFGHDVFTIRDAELLDEAPLAETIRSWQNSGRSVLWIGNSAWLDEQGFAHHDELYTIFSRVMESSYEHKPSEVVPIDWQLPTAFLAPVRETES